MSSKLTIDNDLLILIRQSPKTTTELETYGAGCHKPFTAQAIQETISRLATRDIQLVNGRWEEVSR